MLAELLCLACIALAVASGVYACVKCGPQWLEFEMGDVLDIFRNKSSMKNPTTFWTWAYPLVVGFTFLEIVAFFARIAWALNIGWDDSGSSWASIWLAWHSFAALLCALLQYGLSKIYYAHYEAIHE